MRSPRHSSGVFAASVAAALLSIGWSFPAQANPASPDLEIAHAVLSAGFEPNAGQHAGSIRYLARHREGAYAVREDGVDTLWGDAQMRLEFVTTNPSADAPQGQSRLPGRVSYLSQNGRGHTALPRYARVEQRDLYPGVTVGYTLESSGLAIDFELAAGVSPDLIVMALEPRVAVTLDVDGSLLWRHSGRSLRIQAPRAFQDSASGREEIPARYRIDARGHVGLRIAGYDPSRPLLIDPVLEFSSYLGGSGRDEGFAVATGAAGELYLAGYTQSPDFPLAGPYQTQLGGFASAYVAKLVPDGSGYRLDYATYVGNDVAEVRGLAIDSSGSAYVTGSSSSTEFPTLHAFQPQNAGLIDGYIFKLNPSGTGLVYSSYFGGSSIDRGRAIAVDANGSAYITGVTASPDFPVVNAWQSTNAGALDAFVLKVAPDGTGFDYSTYLGGSAFDYGAGIAVDAAGEAYVTGNTGSADFPVVDALQSQHGGDIDAILTKLNLDGGVLFSSFFGGQGADFGNAVGLDADGQVYIAGQTASTNLPLHPGAESQLSGATDAFAARFDLEAPQLVHSRYFGGTGAEAAYALVADDGRRLHLCGVTQSTDLDLVMPLQILAAGGADLFLATLDMQSGSTLFSTYLGGSGDDIATALTAGPGRRLLLTGRTASSDLPLVAALQTHANGAGESFVLTIALDADGDGVDDYLDNCPAHANADQADRDANAVGDVCEPPRLSGIWPGQAVAPAFIFIFGEYFAVGDYPVVRFNGIASPAVQRVTDDMLIAMLPSGETAGPVTVSNELGSGMAPVPFGVPMQGLQISGAWPGGGVKAGGFVFLFGTGFAPGTSLAIGTMPIPLVQIVTPDMLIFVMPAGAETAPITVTSGGSSVTTGSDYKVLP